MEEQFIPPHQKETWGEESRKEKVIPEGVYSPYYNSDWGTSTEGIKGEIPPHRKPSWGAETRNEEVVEAVEEEVVEPVVEEKPKKKARKARK